MRVILSRSSLCWPAIRGNTVVHLGYSDMSFLTLEEEIMEKQEKVTVVGELAYQLLMLELEIDELKNENDDLKERLGKFINRENK